MRNLVLALWLLIPAPALSAEARDFVIVRFNAGDNDLPIEFTSADKSSKIRLSRQGLYVDKVLICEWYWQGEQKQFQGPLGGSPTRPCPKDSPIVDASVIGYQGESAESTPFTAIRIISIKNWQVEVPYRGKVYRGDVEAWGPRIFAAKGSVIAQRVKAEKKIISETREKELKAIGVAQTRVAIVSCLTPKLKPEPCLGSLVPSGSSTFMFNTVEGVNKLNLDQLKRKLIDDGELRSTFEACVTKFGPKFERGRYGSHNEFIPDKQGDRVILVLDEDAEMGWSCYFKRIEGNWRFIGMGGGGC